MFSFIPVRLRCGVDLIFWTRFVHLAGDPEVVHQNPEFSSEGHDGFAFSFPFDNGECPPFELGMLEKNSVPFSREAEGRGWISPDRGSSARDDWSALQVTGTMIALMERVPEQAHCSNTVTSFFDANIVAGEITDSSL